jgi:hypothetical protein
MRKSILTPLLLTLAALPATSCVFHVGGYGSGEYYVPDDAHTARDLRSDNRGKIDRLQLGMTVDQVKEIMGTSSTWLNEPIGWVSNPYRSESFVDKDGQTELVLYYYTRINKSDNLITDDELTPVGFRDGKLVGWGQSYLERANAARSR